jgi:transcriptional regulator with XRE-family HTH domain
MMNSPNVQHSSNDPNVPKISEIISHLRAHLKLSQAKFAAPLGLSSTQIARFERGIYVPSPEIIKKICEVFDVDERLFGDSSMTVEEAVTSHDIISEISARIRSERKEKGWSQTELAKHAGLTTNTIYRIETGQINLATQTATNIASALDVGIDWLMRGNKDRKNYPADQKMTDWLWEHPDVREKIWDMMKNEE